MPDRAAACLACPHPECPRRTAVAVMLLTPRERDIVILIAAGKTARQAAALLKLARGTVNYRLYRARKRLNHPTNASLASEATRRGLI